MSELTVQSVLYGAFPSCAAYTVFFVCLFLLMLFFFICAVHKDWFSEVLQFSKLEILLTWKEVIEHRRKVVSLKG